jgi:hypothetical protein
MYKYTTAALIAVACIAFVPSSANAAESGECKIYEHYDYKGAWRSVLDNKPMARLGYFNNKISSVKCDPLCSLAAYDFVNFKGDFAKGQKWVFEISTPRAIKFNDRASSLRVTCRI